MRRRQFIVALGSATVVAPLAARAQQQPTAGARRVGVLSPQATTDPGGQRRISALVQALEHLGWTDGGNVQIDYRWAAGDTDRARTFAKELVRLSPDVILVATSSMLAVVRQETRTIPIVFVAVADPVGQGIVASLAHPGGNITGFAFFDTTVASKWLELLKEIAPGIARIALLFNPTTTPVSANFLRAIEAAAPSFAVRVTAALVHDASDINDAITALAGEPNVGLIVVPEPFTALHRELITTLAVQHRLPAVYGLHDFATSGGLISYGPDLVEQFRLAAGYIDRILKGADPGELPVQQPTKFELVVNLKTAKALGLAVPTSLLARADEVVE